MGVLSRLVIFAGFGLSTDAQPTRLIVSVRAPPGLENLKGPQGNQMEYVLSMLEKLMDGYQIQISAD
jgi:hypothetical protein